MATSIEVAPGRRPAGRRPGPAVPAGERRSGRRWQQRLTLLTFIGPALLGILIFLVYPLVTSVYFSFTRFNLLSPPEWIGLANWEHLFEDPIVRIAARNTVWLVVFLVPARVLGALVAGMLLTTLRRGGGIFRTIFYLPALTPPVAATLAFCYILKPGHGPVNTFLDKLGIEGPLWFNSPAWAKPSLVLLGLWGVGDIMILMLAALYDVPQSQYEAAALDGANSWQRFRYVTLPNISPVLLFTTIVGIITTLQYFTQAAVAGSIASGQATVGGGVSSTFGFPENSTYTYPLWLYRVGFRDGLLGYANVLALVLFVVAFGVTWLLLRRAKAFTEGGATA